MFNYDEQELMVQETERNASEDLLEKRKSFYFKILDKYKKRKGINGISFTQNMEKANLIINGIQEEVIYSDIYWEQEGGTYQCSPNDKMQLILRGKYKISVLYNDEVIYWGYNKFPNEINKLMFYIRTESMELLIYFDMLHKVYPIVECESIDKLLDYDVFYESSEDEAPYSFISNLYNALSWRTTDRDYDN